MNHIVFDIEATCDSNRGFPMETIEIGAVKVNEELEIIDKFDVFIKPYKSFITKYCTNLTTITEDDMKEAVSFSIGIKKFIEFVGEDYELLSWGYYDKKQLIKDCKVHNLDYAFLDNHENLKEIYTDVLGVKARGLMKATRNLKITFEGNHHRALPDALATAKIFIELEKKKERHVYCTDCVRGNLLINAIIEDRKIPNNCEKCYPYNPEDSFPMELRKMYKGKSGDYNG